MSMDFFAELEADLDKAVAAQKTVKDRDAARKKANTTHLPIEVRRRASQEFKELEAIIEADKWAAVSTIALFNEQVCDGCGSTHRIFLQYMEVQEVIKRPTTRRWVRVSKPAPEDILRRETLLQPTTTHICANCCEDHGFALLLAERLPKRQDPFTVSATYQQEDINAQTA